MLVAQIDRSVKDCKTVVTQYSLDHYWSQMWNLDIDHMPNSLPDKEKFTAVRNLFHGYSRRGTSSMQMQVGAKETLQKKMRSWTRSKEEQAKM